MVVRLISNTVSADTVTECVSKTAELFNKLQGTVDLRGIQSQCNTEKAWI